MPPCCAASTPGCAPRGILKGESKYYVSLAHTDDDIRHTIAAWEAAIDELKAEGRQGG